VWPLGRRLVGQIVNEPTFPDFCTESGKWFRDRKNCFVGAPAMKQSGMKCQRFEGDGFERAIRPISLGKGSRKPGGCGISALTRQSQRGGLTR
jgi:hypothetical protein